MNRRFKALITFALLIAFLSCAVSEAYRPSTTIVSMGDSFSSGEGILPFYGQKNSLGIDRSIMEKFSDSDWVAHRSTKSWGGRLTLPGMAGAMADYKGSNWYFTAISGATSKGMREGEYKPVVRYGIKSFDEVKLMLDELLGDDTTISYENMTVKDLGNIVYFATNEETDFLGNREPTMEPQIDALKRLKNEGKHIDYITITMGGNDLGFSDIVTKVVMSGDVYAEDGLSLMLQRARAKITDDGWGDTYISLYGMYMEMLQNYADDDTQIIVAGYPRLFCESIDNHIDEMAARFLKTAAVTNPTVAAGGLIGSLLTGLFDKNSDATYALGSAVISNDEAVMVNEAVMDFNEVLESMIKAINDRGYKNIHFVDVSEAFKGHEAYSADPYLNPVIIITRSEDLKFGAASAYSIHPNEKGAQAYADCVQKKIDELEALKRYKYALDRLTEGGSWYEGCVDYVSYDMGINNAAEQIDLYDAKITGYDPNNPSRYNIKAEGQLYDEVSGDDYTYKLNYDGASAKYDYSSYNALLDGYYYSGSEEKRARPNVYDIAMVTDDLFEDIIELNEYSFSALLTEEQYRRMGLDAGGILEAWGDYGQSGEASKASSMDELLKSIYSDPDAMLEYILYGNIDLQPQGFTPVSTDGVIMTMEFNKDMTLDSVRFFTSGTVKSTSGYEGLDTFELTREKYFIFSKTPTDAYSLIEGEEESDYYGYDYEDALEDALEGLIGGFWGLGW